jgi:hypothetical protein
LHSWFLMKSVSNCMEESCSWEANVITAIHNLCFIELDPGVLNL